MGQITRSHGGPSHLPGRVVPQLIFRLFALARSVSSPSCPGFLPRCQQIAGHLALGAALLAVAGISLKDEAHAQTPQPTPTDTCDRPDGVKNPIVAQLKNILSDDSLDCGDADTYLGRITTLTVTDVADSGTDLDPSDLAGLTALRSLTVVASPNLNLDPDDFSHLNLNLRQLSFSGNTGLTLAANDFSSLSSLESLALVGDNALSSLESGVFNGLTDLKSLVLAFNSALNSLPENIFQDLTNLENLVLGRNDFSSLPENIFEGLTKITALQLLGNKLTSLPQNIFRDLGPDLQELELQNNQLTQILPGTFDGLSGLQSLDLSGNLFSAGVQLLDDMGNTIDSVSSVDIDIDARIDTSKVYTIALLSPPSDNVNFSLSSSDDEIVMSDNEVLTFVSSGAGPALYDWNTPRPVRVIAQQNNGQATISHNVVSDDRDYNGRTVDDVTVNVVGVGGPGAVLVTNTEDRETSEDPGNPSVFRASLSVQPTAAVTVTPSSSDTSEGAISAPLTFTPSNWDTAQSVTVTGVDDRQADGNQPYQITFSVSSSDANYNRIVVTPLLFINKDDEESSSLLVTNAENLETSEAGGTATVQMRLAAEPTAAVTVTPNSSDTTEGAVSGPLTFTTSNYDTPQSVTVTGVDDRQADGDQPYSITFTVTSDDTTGYDGYTITPLLFVNKDNEEDPSLLVTDAEDLETSEADGTATVQMRLATEPIAAVTVTPSSSDATEGAVSAPLTFTPSNWDTAQSVTVTGMDDAEVDGDQFYRITFNVSSGDENYNDLQVPSFSVTNRDDDPGLVLTGAQNLETSEAGGTAAFQIRLATVPTAAVTVTPSSEDTGEGVVSAPLTFTPSNWGIDQSVTVTGVDDAEVDDDQIYRILFSVSSSDADYDDVQEPALSVINRYDDEGDPEVLVMTAESPETSEAGGTATIQMRLATRPTAAVIVTPSSSDATEGTVSGPLVFTPSNWYTAQNVTVTGIDDTEDYGDQLYQITFSVSSSDANYNGIAVPLLSVVNRDDGDPSPREMAMEAAQQGVEVSVPGLGLTVAEQALDTIQGRFQGRFLSSPQFNVAGQSMVGTSLDEHLLAWATGRGVVTEQQLVEGTSLDLTLAPGNGVAPGLSLWAIGDLAQFDREDDGLSLDGNVITGLLGGDWGREQWSAGAALARSWSSSSYRSGQQEGESEVNLTTLLPYGHYEVNPQLSVWGMAGYGWGNLSITPDGQEAMETDMNLSMAAVGLEGLLLDGGRDGLSLSSIADVLLVNVSSEGSNDLDETQSDVSRLRLGLQASRSFPLEDDASLAPMVELALRRDGKDDEADFGLDLSVGLDWMAPLQGTRAGLEGRVLLYHAEEGFYTSGITASLEWDPTPATDRGASLSLKHGVGAATGGGMDALLSSANLPDPASTADSREQQFQALLGYGFAPWGEEGLSITPEIGLGLSSRGREYSLSWSTSPYIQPGEESAWEVSTTVKRQENNDSHPAATHSLDLRFSLTL